jgi:hypothetical protein
MTLPRSQQGFFRLESALLEAHNDKKALAMLEKLDVMNELPGPELPEKKGRERTRPGMRGDMFRYLLAVANASNEMTGSGFRGGYAFAGGYAILSHLVSRVGINAVSNWRTSPDLDIVAWHEGAVIGAMNSSFATRPRRSSQEHKCSYNIQDPSAGVSCEIDLYLPDQEGLVHVGGGVLAPKARDRIVELDVLGIPVPTLGVDDLLRLKLNVHGERREKDDQDVMDLISLYAGTGISPRQLVGESATLFPEEQRVLAEILATRREGKTLGLTIGDKNINGRTRTFTGEYLRAHKKASPYRNR